MLDPHLLPPESVDREPVPGPPPVRGAQWDEVHRSWERWDEDDGCWHVVAVHTADHDEVLDEDFVRPPAALGDAPEPCEVIDLREHVGASHADADADADAEAAGDVVEPTVGARI